MNSFFPKILSDICEHFSANCTTYIFHFTYFIYFYCEKCSTFIVYIYYVHDLVVCVCVCVGGGKKE